MNINYESMVIDQSRLLPIRKAIYHSQGPGYYLFPQFIPSDFCDHIVEFYTRLIQPLEWYEPFISKLHIYKGCPNYYSGNDENESFHNYFWNIPPDEVTYSVAFKVKLLRNYIESRVCFSEFFPMHGRNMDGRSASFRVAITRQGTSILPHTDWLGKDGKNFDPRRTQATLFLSTKGNDYSGDSFIFTTNQGKKVILADKIDINPGDLLLWRYNNVHSVENVITKEGQLGFVRIIFPPEKINNGPPWSMASARDLVKARFKQNPFIDKYVKKIYRQYLKIIKGG